MTLLRKGRSIRFVLLISIAGAAVLAYLMTQLLIPELGAEGLTAAQRLSLANMAINLEDAWRPLGVFILMAMASIWLVLQWVLAPVRKLSEHARRIGPANLDERLPTAQAPTEIAPLVDAFNASLDRLETAWKAQRAFSANAAHELRTPLAALRAQLESVLPLEDRGEAAAEFDRLSRIIGQLLVLSEGEHGPLRRSESFDLVTVAAKVAAEAAPGFVRTGREIGLDCAVAALPRRGDPVLVGLAIRNLLDNALKHTPEGSTTTLSIDDEGVLSVADNGPGVSPAFAARAFEPFSRGDPNGGGAGLGLSIVARIAELHGGRAWLADGSRGACFSLWLPPAD